MGLNQMLNSTIWLGILAYVGYQLKSVPMQIFRLLQRRCVFTAQLEKRDELYEYFEEWLIEHHSSKFRNVYAEMQGEKYANTTPLPGKEEVKKLKIRHNSDMFSIKYKGKRILISKSKEKMENSQNVWNIFYESFIISGWFAKSQIISLLQDVVEHHKANVKTIQYIYSNDAVGNWDSFSTVQGKEMSAVVFKDKEALLEDVEDFLSGEEWYIKRGLTYKRGYLLYGAPGNGKTSVCLALAKHLNRDIFFLNINDLDSDSRLFSLFSKIRSNSILVIEDIDAVAGGRKTKADVSFSALLNCMDGVFSKHGIITIMTTNYPDRIDEALIREGRIDMKFEFSNPEKEMVEEYLSTFYKTPVRLDSYFPEISMAKVQEICLRNKDCKEKAIYQLQAELCPQEN
jgi:chaperone BCS1